MKYLPFLALLLALDVHATVIKTEEKGDSKKLYLDYNGDKKVDLIETYNKKDLVKKEQDVDYDGGFDEAIEYFPYKSATEPIEVIKKSDRQTKVYRNEELKKIITTTEVDTDGDGKYDKVISNSEPLVQKRDDACKAIIDSITNAISSLAKNVDQSMTKMSNGYYVGEEGYKVHKSCLDNWGAKTFIDSLTKAKEGGLSCLSDLARKNIASGPQKPNGALTNLNNLRRLYANTPVTMVCNEKEKDWSGTAAHASAGPSDKIKSLNISHPYLSLSPNIPKVTLKPTKDEISEISRTIFHEQLHNLGIRHGEGIEYPYACETCCLGDKEQSKEITDTSCRICSGQYDTKNKKDLSYLRDLLTWGEASFGQDKAAAAINKYQQENPGSQWAIIMQARAESNVFSPLGVEMAKILKKKFANLTKEDQENLDKALSNNVLPQISSKDKVAKPLAEANINYYFDNDPRKAIATLEKSKDQLKAIVASARARASNDSEKYTNETLLQSASKILNQIFMKGYPDKVDKDSSTRAYDLMKELDID